MQRKIALAWTLLVVVGALGVLTTPAEAAPFPEDRQIYLDEPDDDPKYLIRMLTKLDGYLRQQENEKRGGTFGLDFGLNRGYSGTQAAKHMMGMAAANYAGGPGRRRRSEQA